MVVFIDNWMVVLFGKVDEPTVVVKREVFVEDERVVVLKVFDEVVNVEVEFGLFEVVKRGVLAVD